LEDRCFRGLRQSYWLSTRNRRGTIALSEVRWWDQGTINLGMKLINLDHQSIDFAALRT
jgi:hypothetical protein